MCSQERGRPNRGGNSRSRHYDRSRTDDPICDKCGYVEKRSHANGKCPAINAKCRNCKRTGHFERACREKKKIVGSIEQCHCQCECQKKKKADVVSCDPNEPGDPETQTLFMGSVMTTNSQDDCSPWYQELAVNNTKLRFKLDLGADVSILSNTEYKKMKPMPEHNTTQR